MTSDLRKNDPRRWRRVAVKDLSVGDTVLVEYTQGKWDTAQIMPWFSSRTLEHWKRNPGTRRFYRDSRN